MVFRLISTFACGIGVLSCSGDRAAHDSADPEARGAFATARGVTSATGDAGRAFRVAPLRPMSGDVEILSGHPDSVGPFVMRIRELPGTVVPPHTHPVDEHVTVVSGTWYFGMGETFDSTALRELGPGAYAFAPAGTTMFAYSPEGAIVQVHGIGPFHIRWRESAKVLDEPGAASTFRFRKGDEVAGPRGAGRIRQGYASGTLVQYEVERSDGALFMVHEHDLRRR